MGDKDRVAVYFDFDNVVISRYDHLFGDGTWRKDEARGHAADGGSSDPVAVRLSQAAVDVGAIIDYASSFGTVALTRAYADWSVPANAAYRRQLVDRAVDLVQLFATSGTKNGADIRLAIDAVEDLTQHPDITHVVVVAGDSDYIPLAQRCKRTGPLRGRHRRRRLDQPGAEGRLRRVHRLRPAARCRAAGPTRAAATTSPPAAAATAPAAKATAAKRTAKKAAKKAPGRTEEPSAQAEATKLLERAVTVMLQKSDDEWVHSGGLKSQMQRMDAGFKEKSLGFSSFRAFVESRSDVVESKISDNQQRVRLR